MPTRQSLDSARFPRPPPRSAADHRRLSPELPAADESFEDVGLDDKHQQQRGHPQTAQQQTQQHRRRGFFSKFSEHDREQQAPAGGNQAAAAPVPAATTVSRFLMPGRKRGQSGSGMGAEMGAIERPATATSVEEVR